MALADLSEQAVTLPEVYCTHRTMLQCLWGGKCRSCLSQRAAATLRPHHNALGPSPRFGVCITRILWSCTVFLHCSEVF